MQLHPVNQSGQARTISVDPSFPKELLSRLQSNPTPGPRPLRPKRLNVVLICHYGRTGYNILRSLRSVDARVYLIHDERSASLRSSRFCKIVYAAKDLSGADPDLVLDIVNELHLKVGIDRVIASDVESLTLLSQIKDRLLAPVFPTPEAGTLATLNNKWDFYNLCEAAGVGVPKTLFSEGKAGLDAATVERELGFPVIIKPVASYGQRGITILQNLAQFQEWLRPRGDLDHQPIIIQEYIEGNDWAISVFARDGVIEHWVSWICPSQLDSGYGIGRFLATEFRPRDDLFAMCQKIVAATNLSGVANFDARHDDSAGTMKMLECNPRFFNRMSAARLSGLDFVLPGLPGGVTQPFALGDVGYYPWQELFTQRGIKRLVQGQWRLAPLLHDIYEMGTDPLPPIIRKWAREDERD